MLRLVEQRCFWNNTFRACGRRKMLLHKKEGKKDVIKSLNVYK